MWMDNPSDLVEPPHSHSHSLEFLMTESKLQAIGLPMLLKHTFVKIPSYSRLSFGINQPFTIFRTYLESWCHPHHLWHAHSLFLLLFLLTKHSILYSTSQCSSIKCHSCNVIPKTPQQFLSLLSPPMLLAGQASQQFLKSLLPSFLSLPHTS